MSARVKITADFKAISEYAERLEKLGGNIEEVVTQMLQNAHDMTTADIEREMTKHNKTGDTDRSILRNSKVEWSGTVASIDVGFDINNGGLPSIFLMYGTPKHEPGHPGTAKDQALYDAIYGNSTVRKRREMMKTTMDRAIKKRMGG